MAEDDGKSDLLEVVDRAIDSLATGLREIEADAPWPRSWEERAVPNTGDVRRQVTACRLSGCRGRPSSGIGSHGAAYRTNWRALGRTSGSPSKAPMRIPIGSAWAGLRPKSDEPQSPQNHFSPPSGGRQARSLSSPVTIRKVPSTGWAFADAAVPLRRWQRLQWQ